MSVTEFLNVHCFFVASCFIPHSALFFSVKHITPDLVLYIYFDYYLLFQI